MAGAGALGLCIALELARRGRDVVVCDPASPGDNASGVAAGMLAPVFEAALDPDLLEHFDLLAAARDLWSPLADGIGLPIERYGARYFGGQVAEVATRMAKAGVRLRQVADDLETQEDWRLSPPAAISALHAACTRHGVVFEATRVETPPAGPLVLATGAASGNLAPELVRLVPIKGHILRYADSRDIGRVQRHDGLYLCPDPAGATVGATMEAGLYDRRIDPKIVADLRRRAEVRWPELAGLPVTAQAGVRAATPDGLPMVGWSAAPGVLLAVGARRNGWLLAPLVARIIAAYLAGEDPGPYAARLDPRRFDT